MRATEVLRKSFSTNTYVEIEFELQNNDNNKNYNNHNITNNSNTHIILIDCIKCNKSKYISHLAHEPCGAGDEDGLVLVEGLHVPN